jgi:hypothetical protein
MEAWRVGLESAGAVARAGGASRRHARATERSASASQGLIELSQELTSVEAPTAQCRSNTAGFGEVVAIRSVAALANWR